MRRWRVILLALGCSPEMRSICRRVSRSEGLCYPTKRIFILSSDSSSSLSNCNCCLTSQALLARLDFYPVIDDDISRERGQDQLYLNSSTEKSRSGYLIKIVSRREKNHCQPIAEQVKTRCDF